MRERDRYAIYLYENDPYFHRLVDVLIDALENIPNPNLILAQDTENGLSWLSGKIIDKIYGIDYSILHDAVNLAIDKTMKKEIAKETLSEDVTEKYHNPADITLLRKAKDCLKQGIKQLEKYINRFEQTPEEDACIEMHETVLEIDKILRGIDK